MRLNTYKKEILKILSKRHLLTISDIHKSIPKANHSTVFRNVEQLLKEKNIKKILIDNKTVAYESSKESHDHFICNICGKIEPVFISRNLLKGYKIEDIIIRGVCKVCGK